MPKPKCYHKSKTNQHFRACYTCGDCGKHIDYHDSETTKRMELLTENNKKLIELLETVKPKTYTGASFLYGKLNLIEDQQSRILIDEAIKKYKL